MLRLASRTSQAIVDIIVLSMALWLAFLGRFEFDLPPQMFKRLLFLWPYVVGFEYAVLLGFGVTRFAWRYIGLRESMRIGVALGTASACLLAARLVSGAAIDVWAHAQYAFVPIGVIAANLAFAAIGITGARVLRRLLAERVESHVRRPAVRREAVPTLLIGAGQAGVIVAKEICANLALGIRPIGFLDDDPMKLGTVIHGLEVLGRTADLAQLAEEFGARQALIAIANAPGSAIRRITQLCEEASIPAKIIPGIYELIDGQVNLSRIRDVSVEDLLGREAVELDTDLIEGFLTGKRVMITGAGGSIGSELCRQVARFAPASIALVERAEFHLYSIHRELQRLSPSTELLPLLCDVSVPDRVDRVFADYRPQVVFHAAAHKHVPMMEFNPGEAIRNNVLGTHCVADAAHRHGSDAFVMISTDKAVNPTSIMGASKRVAEITIQALAKKSSTKFVAVRFGNVLGSTGSVIPLFKEQIERGGPVTVTHPDMVRYFMTIPEASQLVMQAAAMGHGGEIFVLDMGEPVKIVDLARDLIKLSGFEPDVDIAVEFVGARPGEKLFEELGFDAEKMDKTRHPKIFVGRLAPQAWETVEAHLEALTPLCDCPDRETVRDALAAAVPEMIPDATAAPAPRAVATPAKAHVAPPTPLRPVAEPELAAKAS